MKTPRRSFIKSAALAGTAAVIPGMFSSCASDSSAPKAVVNSTPAVATGTPGTAGAGRKVSLFDSGWRFQLEDTAGAGDPQFDDGQWRKLDLPHDWSIEQPFDSRWASATGYLPGGIGWYRKSFQLPAPLAGRRVHIIFDGVYMNSEVWINGRYLGKRPYGYTSFEYDLTPHLRTDGGANTLAVKVDHSKYADTRWYNGSGIYRHVWLIETGDVHIPVWGTYVTTPEVHETAASIAIETRVKNEGAGATDVTLVSTVLDADGNEVTHVDSTQSVNGGEESRIHHTIEMPNPRLWSPDAPNLYTLVSWVKVADAVVDEYRTPLGIREIVFDPDQGFHLNGKKTLIKGVCIHHDAGCLGSAVPDRALERRLQTLKELGCNAIRTSHNPPAPLLLDLCDRMGFMVMDEAFDEWARPKKKWILGRNNGDPGFEGYATYFQDWGITDIQTMVLRDRNHPSIILWSIGNEIDYSHDPYYDPNARDYTADKPSAAELPIIAAKLAKAVKELDTTRPVTAALATISVSNPTGLADVLDVVGYNYQESLYEEDHAKYPTRKLIGSENSHTYNAWKTILDLPYANGQFLWTGIDYLGESSGWPGRGSGAGILDECGFKKPGFYFRQSLWSDKPMVYAGPRASQSGGRGGRGRSADPLPHWNLTVNEGATVNVGCYSNCETVELWLNDKSLGKKTLASASNATVTWQVPYSAGTLKAVGKNGGAAVCSFELKTAGDPRQITLSPDLNNISADGRSLSHIEVNAADASGVPVYAGNQEITFELSGPGRIIGVDTGDTASHENFKGNSRKLYHGKCLVIVQSTSEPGTITLKATADGLDAGQVDIATAPPA
jgi:beta-galactosidase